MFASDEEDLPADGGFKINEKFASKFEYNNKRVELEKLEAKYGKAKNLKDDEQSYTDSSESEDSDAYLNTEKAETKFVDLINRIKGGDKSLLELKDDYFQDEDF